MPSKLITALTAHGPEHHAVWAYLYNVGTVSKDEGAFMLHEYPRSLEQAQSPVEELYKQKVAELVWNRPNMFQKYQKSPGAHASLWLMARSPKFSARTLVNWLPSIDTEELNTSQGRKNLEFCLNHVFAHGRPDLDCILQLREAVPEALTPYISIIAATLSILNEDDYTPVESYGLTPAQMSILRFGYDMNNVEYEMMQPLFAALREPAWPEMTLPVLDGPG